MATLKEKTRRTAGDYPDFVAVRKQLDDLKARVEALTAEDRAMLRDRQSSPSPLQEAKARLLGTEVANRRPYAQVMLEEQAAVAALREVQQHWGAIHARVSAEQANLERADLGEILQRQVEALRDFLCALQAEEEFKADFQRRGFTRAALCSILRETPGSERLRQLIERFLETAANHGFRE